MKRRVCYLLLGICLLCLPEEVAFAAPAGPVARVEETKEEKEKPVPPHEQEEKEKPVPPHEQEEKEKPIPPHEQEEKEKPVPPHELENPKPHEIKKTQEEEKKGSLGEETPEPPTPQEKETAKPVLPHEKEKQVEANKQQDALPTEPSVITQEPTTTPVITQKPTTTPAPTVVQTVTQTTTQSPTSVSALGNEIVKYALKFVGNPYVYGGTSLTNGADCSGFVQSVYARFGYSIPRTSREQAVNAGYREVSLKESELLSGDLIFYARSNGVVYHVALYIGNGKIVHAANTNAGIVVSDYDNMKPYKARRVIP